MDNSTVSNGKLNGKPRFGRIARPDLEPRPDDGTYSEQIPELLYPRVEELVELPMTDDLEHLSGVTTPNPVYATMMRMTLEDIARLDRKIVRNETRWINEQDEARWDAAALTPDERRDWDTRRREHESQQGLLEGIRVRHVLYAREVRNLIALDSNPAYCEARRREEEMWCQVQEQRQSGYCAMSQAEYEQQESNSDGVPSYGEQAPRKRRRRKKPNKVKPAADNQSAKKEGKYEL